MISLNEWRRSSISTLMMLLLLIGLQECFQTVESKMTLRNILNNKTIDAVIYNSVSYNQPPPSMLATNNEVNLVLNEDNGNSSSTPLPLNQHRIGLPMLLLDVIPLDRGFAFNPCDVSTFNVENIAPVLDEMFSNHHQSEQQKAQSTSNNVTSVSSWRETGWIAVVRYDALLELCNGPIPHFFLAHRSGLNCQLLNVTAVANDGSAPGITIRNEPGTPIDGLNIPVYSIDHYNSNEESSNAFQSNALKEWVVESIEVDPNPFDSWFEPFGFYRIAMWILGVYSLLLVPVIILVIREVIMFFNGKLHEAKSRMSMVIRLGVLVPELLANIGKAVAAYDPYGFFYEVNHVTAQVVMETWYVFDHHT